MNATIVVSPSPYFATVGEDGAFEIRGIPPGRYRVRTWCERLPSAEDIVTLGDREGIFREMEIGRKSDRVGSFLAR